jgi:hypothetical protein
MEIPAADSDGTDGGFTVSADDVSPVRSTGRRDEGCVEKPSPVVPSVASARAVFSPWNAQGVTATCDSCWGGAATRMDRGDVVCD